jgi:hypothetical protein
VTTFTTHRTRSNIWLRNEAFWAKIPFHFSSKKSKNLFFCLFVLGMPLNGYTGRFCSKSLLERPPPALHRWMHSFNIFYKKFRKLLRYFAIKTTIRFLKSKLLNMHQSSS